MIDYDRRQPLIANHVPKAAGTTVRKVFEGWFGKGLLLHYFDEQKGQMPRRYELDRLDTANRPTVVYGHFNRLRGFGVQDYYPGVTQFVTILRDPYDLMLSHFFFTRQAGSKWKYKTQVPDGSLADYLLATSPNMLNHFPRPVTSANYKEVIDKYFVYIGFTEQLAQSLRQMARKLGKQFDERTLGRFNVTDRDEEVPDHLREKFIDKNELEYAVYDYALRKFADSHEASE
ncbi:MAG: sulfotransferase family protein [Gammaproteobacteria bacterium]|nr:sulfotransferase family protein [Gammaproteobacteria bacterium]